MKRTYQDYSGIYNRDRHCISWSYTRTPRFLYSRNAFGSLMYRKLLSKYVSFNKTVLARSFRSQRVRFFMIIEDFLSALSLIYYASIISIPLCILLNLHWAASNQCPEKIEVKNGELNLDWVATCIIQLNHFKRPSPINKRPVIMSNQCPQRTVVLNNGKLNLYWAPTAIE